jgi:nitrate/nitrite transporter NarK
MIISYANTSTLWLWFWSKEALGLSRQDIFQAIAWGPLLNACLAYPMGWVIDRFGGLKVVVTYWILCVATFILFINVHDKTGLTFLILLQTLVFPLYQAANIMVFKASPPQDVGSITSTSACIRNVFIGCLSLITGWTIYLTGHNYVVGYAIGLGLSTVGLCFMLIHNRLMKPKPAAQAISNNSKQHVNKLMQPSTVNIINVDTKCKEQV